MEKQFSIRTRTLERVIYELKYTPIREKYICFSFYAKIDFYYTSY